MRHRISFLSSRDRRAASFHVVDQWKPEWKMWLDFEHHRAAAFDLDGLPPGLVTIVERAMAREQADRYPTAAELELDEVMQRVSDALGSDVAEPEWETTYDVERKVWRAVGRSATFR